MHPGSFCPPWSFPAGMWQRREQNETCSCHGHCWPLSLCCAISLWNLLLSLPLPPQLGAVSSWQPFPAPTRAPVVPLCRVGSVCWECASSLGVSLCSRADRLQSFWACQLQRLMKQSLFLLPFRCWNCLWMCAELSLQGTARP